MTALILIVAVAAAVVLSAMLFVSASPSQLARIFRVAGPVVLGLVGAALSLFGRVSLGAPLIMMAVAWYGRQRRVSGSRRTGGQKSVVRSAWLEMELDHDSGDMDGVVLVGRFEGRRLFEMSDEEVVALAADLNDDRESAELLEAYLDRRMPGWRDDAEPDGGPRERATHRSGPMTHEEAYKVLGLDPGASAVEIRKAHRSLMQRVHPDLGGNGFLAQRVNEARDVLLRDHAD